MLFGRLNSLWKSAAPELIAVESLPTESNSVRDFWGSSLSSERTELSAWAPTAGIARCQPCQISQTRWDFPYGIARSHAGHSSWTHPALSGGHGAQHVGHAAALWSCWEEPLWFVHLPCTSRLPALCPKALWWPFPGQHSAVSAESLAACAGVSSLASCHMQLPQTPEHCCAGEAFSCTDVVKWLVQVHQSGVQNLPQLQLMQLHRWLLSEIYR